MSGRRGFGLGILAGIVAVVAVAAVAGLLVVYTGAYDVAATDKHAPFARWALDTTMQNSVERRAAGLSPPAALDEAGMSAGAEVYGGSCVHCHAGPGVERAEWASEMLPMPPELIHAATEWSAGEIYWIVRHGIKMSGMPPFGPHHDEATLWSIAAFVKELPGMTAEDFAGLTGGGGHHGGDTRDNGHGG